MNMMQSAVQLLLIEKHAGCACGYIKKLTNFQNKNSHNSHFQILKKDNSETAKYYYQQYY